MSSGTDVSSRTTENDLTEPPQAPAGATPNEKVVLDLIRTTFQLGAVREGVSRCIGETYIQHNPRMTNGREALVEFFENIWASNPGTYRYRVHHVISSGDLVCVHASSNLDGGKAIFDLFRVADGLIIEHWDVVQPVPADTVSGNSMF